MADQKQTVREVTIEGVVHEFDGEIAEVILNNSGNDEHRHIDTEYLKKAGITHTGQSFYIHGREYTDGKTEVLVSPIGDPNKVTTVNIRPDLDLSKFKRLS
ncbi:MAG: hypothetical protein AABX29_09655 [Nanoarchaeota archaeon]